jgi:hypothetical protein
MKADSKAKRPNQPAEEKRNETPKALAPATGIAGLGTELGDLPARQRTALLSLAAGQGFNEAARAAGVTRQALFAWRTKDARFQAAFNAWQHDAIASARSRLVGLLENAVTALTNAVQESDTRTALEVVRRLGVLDPVQPGPTDPTLMERTIVVDQREREAKLEQREQNLDDDVKMQKFFDLMERGGLNALGGKPGA